jgi:hypothetical protein
MKLILPVLLIILSLSAFSLDKKKSINYFNITKNQDSLKKAQVRVPGKDDTGFMMGIGFVDGGEYGNILADVLRARGYTVSGFTHFLNFEAGFEFRMAKSVYLNPRIRWIASQVKYSYGNFYSSQYSGDVNSIFLFGLGVKYAIYESLLECFYVNAEMSYISTSIEVKGLSIKPDGLQKGIFVGYQHDMGVGWLGGEIGYMEIPVSVMNIKKNFGGFFINLVGYYPIGNYGSR